ncbi:MAG: hypothetical protein AB7P03_11685 [Kofleriaceae bacterium]
MNAPSPAAPELFERIEQLEQQVERAQIALARHQARTPMTGCGSPEHAAAPDRIRELEAELALYAGQGDARRRAQLERLGNERPIRLAAELRRLTDEIQRVRVLATGSPAVLEKLKRMRDRKSLLEARHGALDETARELAHVQAAAATNPPVVWVPAPRDRLLTRYQLIKLGLALACVLPVLGASYLVYGALAMTIVAIRTATFGGVRASELVGPEVIYGAPWSDVRSIAFPTPRKMVVIAGGRSLEFDDRMPAFREVVRFALAAAGHHQIPVTGEPPPQLGLAPGPERAKRPTR